MSNRDERIEYGIQKLTPKIMGLARQYSNSVSEIDDLVQEAILKIIEVNDDNMWDPNREGAASYTTYLYTCVKNAIFDIALRDKYAMSIPSGSIKSVKNTKNMRGVSLSDDLPDNRSNAYELIDIQDTVDNFDHHRIGAMYFQERRTMKEISDMTGFSVAKVSRIVKNIQGLLQNRLAV
jgi:RNA polymerase sigma factor (sigma-70 family)